MDGISRGFNVFLRRLITTHVTSHAIAPTQRAGCEFWLPISETQRINFGVMAEYTEITEGYYAAQEISEFIEVNGLIS